MRVCRSNRSHSGHGNGIDDNEKEQSAFADRILLQLSVDNVIQLPPSEDAIAV